MRHPPIFFLTDFGHRDVFVGVMKAVALGMGFNGTLVDLNHGISPQDVLAGALALEDAWPFIPVGSVVVAVVDPGVGGARRALAFHLDGRYVVAPDNGLLSALLSSSSEVRLISKGGPVQPERSATFHGRDVFTPAAVLMAMGTRLFDDIGPTAANPTRLQLPRVMQDPKTGATTLTVLSNDHFGNAVLNISLRAPSGVAIEVGEFTSTAGLLGPLRRTYGDVAHGNPVVYWNAFGRLEVAVNGGSAAEQLGLRVGAHIYFKPDPQR